MANVMKNLKARKSKQERRGVALIEMALVLLLLLTLTFAILEYGWIFLKSHHIANAARQGARVAARPDATQADVDAAVLAAMTGGGIEDSEYTVVITPADITAVESGDILSVRVEVTYANIELGFPLLPTPVTLGSELSMAKEGP